MNIDFGGISIQYLATHLIGNKGKDEKLKLSESETDISDDSIDLLIRYFLSGFNFDEEYNLSHPVSLQMNEIYQVAADLFKKQTNFLQKSRDIANLLYQYSVHPKIKEGELNVAYFTNLIVNDKKVEAIGIFKSETTAPFLKMKQKTGQYKISHESGYDVDRIDKGCIIFNMNEAEGFKVLLADRFGKKEEAQYWKDEFLKLKPVSDSYHFTNNILSVAKNFITEELPKYEVTKTEQIDFLNRSVEYFKSNETFEIGNFQEQVFNDQELISKFQDFGSSFISQNNMDIADSFDISSQAVKKQARIFKSVLKLDKNFHVYIHGDTNLIEKGFDEKRGKHFYKIYFEQEQ
jgi:hypothetical protein